MQMPVLKMKNNVKVFVLLQVGTQLMAQFFAVMTLPLMSRVEVHLFEEGKAPSSQKSELFSRVSTLPRTDILTYRLQYR